MKKVFLVLLLTLITTSVLAQDVCVTIDTSTWTQSQKNMRQAIAYSLIYEAGEDIIPKVNGENICFNNATLDISAIITAQTILDRYAQEKAKEATALAQIQSWETELENLTTQLDADDTNWTSLTTAQKLAIMKKVLRREVLKRKLGQ